MPASFASRTSVIAVRNLYFYHPPNLFIFPRQPPATDVAPSHNQHCVGPLEAAGARNDDPLACASGHLSLPR